MECWTDTVKVSGFDSRLGQSSGEVGVPSNQLYPWLEEALGDIIESVRDLCIVGGLFRAITFPRIFVCSFVNNFIPCWTLMFNSTPGFF